MKKITLCLILILTLILPSIVLAIEPDEPVAKIGDKTYATLAEAVNAASVEGTNTTIKLIKNVKLDSTLDISGNVTLDLNGCSITPTSTLKSSTGLIIVPSGGTLTINDSVGTGKISGGTDNDNLYAAVQVTKKDVSTEKTATLIVNGGTLEGYYYGITGNGSRHNTSITINGGTIIGVEGPGIYHPQDGTINVNGGNIEGITGIEMRAGKLIVENGTITGTYKPTTVSANGNGTTTDGAGIAIAQHTTKLDTSVVVKGGTINGFTALYQSNPQNNDETAVAKVSVAINGGKFYTINDGTVSVYSENKTKFITGGKFSTDVTDYIADGYVCKKIDNEYVVGKEKTITVKDVEGGKVIANPTKAISGETITLTVVPDEGYKLEKIEITDGRMGDTLIGTTTFKMLIGDTEVIPVFTKLKTDAEVSNNVDNAEKVESMLIETLKENKELAEAIKDKNVEIKVEVKEKEVTKTEKETIETAVNKEDTDLKVANYIDITITVKDADNGDSLGKLSTVKETITFTVAVPENLPKLEEGYERIFYIVRNHDGEIELLNATETDGKLKFESDKFSTYAIAYKDVEKTTTDTTIKDNSKEDIPQTGDNIIMFIIIFALALTGILAIFIIDKKKLKNNK